MQNRSQPIGAGTCRLTGRGKYSIGRKCSDCGARVAHVGKSGSLCGWGWGQSSGRFRRVPKVRNGDFEQDGRPSCHPLYLVSSERPHRGFNTTRSPPCLVSSHAKVETRPTMTKKRDSCSYLADVVILLHSLRSCPDGFGTSSGCVCHSPKYTRVLDDCAQALSTRCCAGLRRRKK